MPIEISLNDESRATIGPGETSIHISDIHLTIKWSGDESSDLTLLSGKEVLEELKIETSGFEGNWEAGMPISKDEGHLFEKIGLPVRVVNELKIRRI